MIAAAHIIRWVLELLFVWVLVFPETGIWTAICLTLLTAGVEANYFIITNIQKALVRLADEMIALYKT